MNMRKLLALAVLCLAPCYAATTITETVRNPDGTLFNGKVIVSLLTPITTVTGATILNFGRTYTITAGILTITLEPNDTAIPAGTSYTVRYQSTASSALEYWTVPTSATPVTLSAVRVSTIPTPALTVALSQLSSSGAVKGDLIAFGTAWGRVAVGTNGYVLTADSTQARGVGWAAAAATGITSLNALTGGTQTFAVGTSGTNFAIVSSSTTHTFNLPTSSASNRGALAAADFITFNAKESALTFTSPLVRTVNAITCPTCGGAPGGATDTIQVNNAGAFAGRGTFTSAGNMGISGYLSVGVGGTKTGALQMPGATSGSNGFAVPDVAGTAILYVMPATAGTAGQFLKDTGAITCPTLDAAVGSPICHLMQWAATAGSDLSSISLFYPYASCSSTTATNSTWSYAINGFSFFDATACGATGTYGPYMQTTGNGDLKLMIGYLPKWDTNNVTVVLDFGFTGTSTIGLRAYDASSGSAGTEVTQAITCGGTACPITFSNFSLSPYVDGVGNRLALRIRIAGSVAASTRGMTITYTRVP